MNLILSLILLTVAGIAYVAFNIQQQTDATFQQRIGEWQDRVKQLQESITLEQSKESNWKAQLAKAREEAAHNPLAVLPAPAPSVESSETNPAAHATPSDLNNLGTITTIDGKSFYHCQLLKVEPDGITFNHSEGITKVLFPFLTPEMRKRFGYDPEKTTALEAAEVRYQDQLRAAAAAANNGGNAQPSTQ